MEKETQIRERVRELRVYYTNLVVYAGVAGSCILVWLLNGAGAFWPIWPIMGFGIAAALQGVRLGQLKAVEDFLPFLTSEWEEKQVKSLLHSAPKDNREVKISNGSTLKDVGEKVSGSIMSEKVEEKIKKPKEKVKKMVKKITKPKTSARSSSKPSTRPSGRPSPTTSPKT